MVTDHTAHPGILAGAPAPDRRAFPHPGSVPRWFEPFHVRQPQVARGEVTAQVVAGADIVVAPAWLTHRRTLEAVGESRRAREWTMAAVRMTREGVEAGLERRGGPGPVLVAGPLPDVAAGPEHATGRRLPVPASAERDTHDQAGILADAGVDLVLLEGRSSFEAARLATETTADTGRPTWTTIPIADAKGTPPLLERIAVLVASGAAGVLLEMDGTTDTARVTGALAAAADTTTVPVGLVTGTSAGLGTDDQLDAWIQAGAGVLGVAAGADPDALAPLVAARDRLLGALREREEAERTSLAAWVGDAARRAPGGRALWLGAQQTDLPSGFDWTVVATPDDTLRSLPEGAFRLVVCLADVAPEVLARSIEEGGILALQAADGRGVDPIDQVRSAHLRVQDAATTPDGRVRLICRRKER